jgi:hypothetical protein
MHEPSARVAKFTAYGAAYAPQQAERATVGCREEICTGLL